MDGNRCFGAARRELQNGLHLLSCNTEFFHELVNAHILKVFKNRRHRRARAAKNPCAAALSGDAFHGGAL